MCCSSLGFAKPMLPFKLIRAEEHLNNGCKRALLLYAIYARTGGIAVVLKHLVCGQDLLFNNSADQRAVCDRKGQWDAHVDQTFQDQIGFWQTF